MLITLIQIDAVGSELLKMGVLGIGIVAFGWYILHQQKRFDATVQRILEEHKGERDEWRSEFKESTRVHRETGGLIQSLKTLLESTREKK